MVRVRRTTHALGPCSVFGHLGVLGILELSLHFAVTRAPLAPVARDAGSIVIVVRAFTRLFVGLDDLGRRAHILLSEARHNVELADGLVEGRSVALVVRRDNEEAIPGLP